MKAVILAMAMVASLNASAKVIKVQYMDYDKGPNGELVTIYIKDRGPSAPLVESCTVVNEFNSATTCDIETSTGALKAIEKFFDKVLNIKGQPLDPNKDMTDFVGN